MPLPTIEVPKYKLKIPSSGKMVTFRPFLVKEEKILLTVLETNSNTTSLSEALAHLIDNCIITKDIDIESLAPFDLEYIFLQLRAKSVGETVELQVKCKNEDCSLGDFPWEVDLGEMKVIKDKEHTNKIELSDELGIIMKYPTMKDSYGLNIKDTEDIFGAITNCIDSIYTKEEVFSSKDHTKEELEEFIEQLSPEYFKKIIVFFETMPSMSNDIECTCPKCKEVTTIGLRGIEDFFI